MKKTDLIRIQYFVTKEDSELIEKHAKRARLKLSEFCKMVLFARINNYPLKDDKGGNQNE